MKIVSLDALSLGEDVDFSSIESLGTIIRYPLTSYDERLDRVKDADAILVNKVPIDRVLIENAPRLKLVCVSATGVNNIDQKAAEEMGVAVCNVKDYSTESVVQHTFSLFFYLYNHLPYYDAYVKSGAYAKSPLFTHFDRTIFELSDKTWGIIGLGNIGRRVAQVASSFGCNVIYHSTSGKNNNKDYKHVDLEQLLTESDVISIHAPLNPDTKNLITGKELSQMQKHAILINVGRGGIVHEKDLAVALDSHGIEGAALDVLENEPMEPDHPLLNVRRKDRLVMTPHIAWATREARQRVIEETAKNIQAFLNGERRNRIV